MLPFDIRHIVVCHVQKKLFTIKNSPVFFGPRLNVRVHSSKVELAAAGVHPVGMVSSHASV